MKQFELTKHFKYRSAASAAILVLLSFAGRSYAQSFKPLWAKGSYTGVYTISADGKYLEASGNYANATTVYSTVKQQIVLATKTNTSQSVITPAGLYGVEPSTEGIRKIVFYPLPTGKRQIIWTSGINDTQDLRMAVSADGTKLAWVSKLSTRYDLWVIDLATKARLGKVKLPSFASIPSIIFVAGDQNVLVGARYLYTSNGASAGQQLASPSSPNVALNAQRTRAYVSDGNGQAACIDTTNMSIVWSDNKSAMTNHIQCSADGKALIDQDPSFGLRCFRTTNGSLIGKVGFYGLEFAANPTANGFYARNEENGQIQKWLLNTSSGIGKYSSVLSSCHPYGVYPAGPIGSAVFGALDDYPQYTTIRSKETGEIVNDRSVLASQYSLDGTYYATYDRIGTTSNFGVQVFSTADNHRVASYPLQDNQLVRWGTGNRFVACTNNTARVFKFDGTNITLISTLETPSSFDLTRAIGLTPDGKQFVAFDYAYSKYHVYTVDTGLSDGFVAPGSAAASSILDNAQSLGGSKLYLPEWQYIDAHSYKYRVRIVDLSVHPYLTKWVTVSETQGTTGGCANAVSPDGSLIAFAYDTQNGGSNIRVISSANAPVFTWKDTPIGGAGWGFSSMCFSQDGKTLIVCTSATGIIFGLDVTKS